MTDEFLQRYKELEQLIIENYEVPEGSSAVWALGDVREFFAFRPQLNAIREIRNFLAHQPMVDSQYLIEPAEAALRILNNIISKIEGPKNVYSLCIKPSGISSAKIDDRVAPIIKLMKEKSFQVVPIISNGKLEGVFFDSAAVLVETESGTLDEDTTFYQLKKYIELSSHIGKDVLFLPKSATIETAKEIINEYFQNGNRIAVIFVTESGRQSETLLGMVLPLQLI